MIDTHLHILPGVDDGPATIQEALMLASALVQEGVTAAIATPHSNDEYPRYMAADIARRVAELQYMLVIYDIPLRVFAGNEVLIRPGLLDDIQHKRVMTLNGGRYLLLELWNTIWLPETERVVFELRSAGIVPIIAHPERYSAIQRDPKRLLALLQQGALAQLTASSVLGLHGSTVRRTAETLLKREMVHIIASDAHGLYRRPPYIARSMRHIEKLIGRQRLQYIAETCPTAIINNQWITEERQDVRTGV